MSSDPPVGGTLPNTPYTLTATFDDELTADGSSILIENGSGTQVAAGSVSSTDAHVLTAELPSLPAATYTVRWTAVSADDAAVERGSYTFNVGYGLPSSPPIVPGPKTESTDALIAIGLAAVFLVIIAFATIWTVRRRR